MTTKTSYPEGMFSWVDLVAHDLEAATEWYAQLFGWEAKTMPTGGGPAYVMFYEGGHAVAGAGQMSDEMKAQGVPPLWNDYITVTDAAAVEARAKQLGGSVMMPTMQVMDAGTMAFIQDPGGAAFGIWQPGSHVGAGLVSEPGGFCWNELMTPDVEKAKGFYGELFGWTYEAQPMPGFTYTTIKTSGGDQNGGMVPMLGPQWEGIPPHWMTYFAVASIDDTVAKVEATGGRICVPITEIPGVGRFAVINDPEGGTFTALQLAQLPS